MPPLLLALILATVAPRGPARLERLPAAPVPARTEPAPGDLIINADTEILLDGRRVPFSAITPDAEVVELAVARDGRTVTRIGFRSRPSK